MTSQASSAVAGVARGPLGRGWLGHAFGLLVEHRSRVLAGIAAVSIVAGGALYLAGEHSAAQDVWGAAVALLSAELAVEVVRTVIVDHHMGVDTIALVAMVGALALGEEFAGIIIGLMFSGVVVIEEIFGWPGIGQYMAQSIPAADFPAISGVTLLLGVGYVAVNAIVDILQAVADPRINA